MGGYCVEVAVLLAPPLSLQAPYPNTSFASQASIFTPNEVVDHSYRRIFGAKSFLKSSTHYACIASRDQDVERLCSIFALASDFW